MVPDFKLYYRIIVIKIVWCWHKSRHTDKLSRIREPRNKPTYMSVNGKGAMKMKWGKDGLFKKWCWEKWAATCKIIKYHTQK